MGSAKSRTRPSDFTFTFHFHALEKEMATHSSVLAWRIPGTGGAWWAALYGVAQSRTRLKGLSSSSSAYILIHEQTTMYALNMYMCVYVWIFSYILILGLHCFCSVASVVSNFFAAQTVAQQLLCPWDSLGKNTGVVCYFLLQGIFLT